MLSDSEKMQGCVRNMKNRKLEIKVNDIINLKMSQNPDKMKKNNTNQKIALPEPIPVTPATKFTLHRRSIHRQLQRSNIQQKPQASACKKAK